MALTRTTLALPLLQTRHFASWLRVITQRRPSVCLTRHRLHTLYSLASLSPTSAAGPSDMHMKVEVMCFGYANHDDRLTSTFNNLFFIRNARVCVTFTLILCTV